MQRRTDCKARRFIWTMLSFILSLFINAQNKMIVENSKTSGYALVNGIKMYYEIYGNGTVPLVLIHGGGSTIETTFGNMLPLLSSSGKIIAVELQAHGRTSDRESPESFEQDAEDVIALLKYLKVDKADFFGFSNGGTTTLRIAIKHPEMVNKIIVASAAYKRDGFIPGFFEGMPNATLDNMPELLKVGYLKVNPDRKGLLTMFNKDKERMIHFKDWPDSDLRSIKAASLIISADHDVVTSEHTLKMSQLIQNARLAILPGTPGSFIGEICTEKKDSKLPEMTAALIKDFLNE